MDRNKTYREARDEFLAEQAERQHAQQQQRSEAERELLDTTTLGEYMERRNAQKFLTVEPDCPLDEMTLADYRKVRNNQNAFSYREYIRLREGDD